MALIEQGWPQHLFIRDKTETRRWYASQDPLETETYNVKLQ